MAQLRRYRITWRGPWDSVERGDRILTLQATSKKEALKCHNALFPVKKRSISWIRSQ
jgi:hypothetical protein